MTGASKLAHLKFWEPEETVGRLWDRLTEQLADAPRFPDAAVTLDETRVRLGVLFHALGGDPGVGIKAGGERDSAHRRSWRHRLARATDKITAASFDGIELRLPQVIDTLPTRPLNGDLYLWLAALTTFTQPGPPVPADPLQADVVYLAGALQSERAALDACCGLAALRDRLYPAVLAARPSCDGPATEARLEAWIRHRLAGAHAPPATDALAKALEGDPDALAALVAPKGYHRCRPVPVWIDVRPSPGPGPGRGTATDETPGSGSGDNADKRRSAERRKADQANRRDNLILHRFESILSWADFLNINRPVEDDDEGHARRAADDAGQLGVVEHRRRPKTLLKLDLDLAPEDAMREEVAGKFVYPEWNWKTRQLDPSQCRVLENTAPSTAAPRIRDPKASRRIEAVRRRFEALRPRRRTLSRQTEGGELDLDEVVRALADRRAGGPISDRLYCDARNEERDLAVAVLFDASRSTESAVEGRSVIAIGREALEALARGFHACGDQVALYAFSSLRRSRIFVDVCKTFDEPFGAEVDARVAALKPGFYTRLGAAIRHVSFRLSERPNARKLLLLITDGKPNDLDHYEGRYGLEDTRHAVQEARRLGQAVFTIAIDGRSSAHLPHLFGRAGYAVVPATDRLVEALPVICQHILS